MKRAIKGGDSIGELPMDETHRPASGAIMDERCAGRLIESKRFSALLSWQASRMARARVMDLFRNHTAPDGQTKKNVLIVRDPAQLRSRFAKFDPVKINSSDLLAGLFGAGATGLLGQMMTGEKAPRNEQKRLQSTV